LSNILVKIIEELNKKISNITAEKKLVEDLLKNALLQNEISKKKEREREKQQQPRHVLASLDLNVLKNSNRTSSGHQSFVLKASNERESTNATQTSQRNSVGSPTVAISLVPDKDEEMQRADTSFLNTPQAQAKFLQQINNVADVEEIPEADEESERFLSNRVRPPQPTISLKDKFDMSQLKLDLTQVLKNRK
jgi:hypothetical protein